MKKERNKNIEKKRVILIIIGIAAGILNIATAAPIFFSRFNELVDIQQFGGILLLLWAISWFVLAIIGNYLMHIRYLRKTEEKVKKSLLKTEFSHMKFTGWREEELREIIPKECVQCIAKLDESGKINYKIHIDIESSTENYANFDRYFYLE